MKPKSNKEDSPLKPEENDDPTEFKKTVYYTFSGYNKREKNSFEKEKKEEMKSITDQIEELLSTNSDFETLKKLFQNLASVEKKKLESLKAGSTWSIDTLIKFIPKFQINVNYVKIEKYMTFVDDLTIFKEVKKGFTKCGKIITKTGISTTKGSELSDVFKELLNHKNRETSIRTLIDALLFPIAKMLELNILFEETLKYDNLPTSIPDYIIVNTNKEVVGVVETKDAGKMEPKSLVQALLQLISLQKLKCASKIFAVVTDAKNYHVMILSGNTLVLDSKEDSKPKCKIRTVKSWDGLEKVTNMLFSLCSDDSSDGSGSDASASE